MDIRNYKKIILVGSPGGGKSWLSKRVAEITGYPLFHLDKELHLPNWQKLPKNQRTARMHEMMSGEQWIIDGNWGSTMETRFSAAELVIFLDVNRVVCLYSAIKRRSKPRTDMPDFLEEPKLLSKNFRDFAKFIAWTFPRIGKKAVLDLHQKYPNTAFLHIKGRRGVRRILKEWGVTNEHL